MHYFYLDGNEFSIMRVSKKDMDKMRNQSIRQCGFVTRGYPNFYSKDGRYYPEPQEGLEIVSNV